MANALAGRVALVTGDMVGIGLASAQDLAEQGASVAIGARRGGQADMVATTLEVLGLEVLGFEVLGPDVFIGPLDVCEIASVKAFVKAISALKISTINGGYYQRTPSRVRAPTPDAYCATTARMTGTPSSTPI